MKARTVAHADAFRTRPVGADDLEMFIDRTPGAGVAVGRLAQGVVAHVAAGPLLAWPTRHGSRAARPTRSPWSRRERSLPPLPATR